MQVLLAFISTAYQRCDAASDVVVDCGEESVIPGGLVRASPSSLSFCLFKKIFF